LRFSALLSLPFAAWGAVAHAQTEKATVIQIRFVERHDRLTPDVDRNIEWANEFTVTLTGKNNISETQTSTYRGSSHYPATNALVTRISHTDTRDTALGEGGEKFVWQVLGPRKLRRITTGIQFIMMIDVNIGEDNNCHTDVKYLKQKGFNDVIMKRAGTQNMEHFTIPHVVSASCSIQ
jgi:hypothetical protein